MSLGPVGGRVGAGTTGRSGWGNGLRGGGEGGQPVRQAVAKRARVAAANGTTEITIVKF